ncbi:MAG: DDE-type integrase/transposase/recombinase [Alphaproteobacteria bacterium]|nr:DDE-type integrase/transposase/recombinase [Alphaproteobacteria bacterium]
MICKISGERVPLWRAVDDEGEVLEACDGKTCDRGPALRVLRMAMKRCGAPKIIVTDRLRSYDAAMKDIGNAKVQ